MDKNNVLEIFMIGENFYFQYYLGVYREEKNGEYGYIFCVWVFNVQVVYLVGDFINWVEN